MKSIELKGTIRESVGKKNSKALRVNENVPCILYGGKNSVYFSVIEKDLKEIIYTPKVYLISLNIKGKKHLAKIQDIQYHPVTDSPAHIDFYEVSDDKKIVIEVPVRVEGNSVGVKEGGKMSLDSRKVKVKGLVKDIPDEIVLDITNVGLGKSIRVGDLTHDKVDFMDLKNNPVVSVKLTRIARGSEAPPAEIAAAAAAAAAPAAAAPAAAPAAKA
jgi:large subunit ribosomal protein L25